MTDETKPTTEEFLKMLEEAKAEWKRYNTMREAAPEMLHALNMFPDPADFANSEDYREATNRWWDDKALPAINAAKGNK